MIAWQKVLHTPKRLLTPFKCFYKNNQGVIAIEFAILAPIFFLIVFSIIETCLSYAGQQVMMNAADSISRKIKTGNIKTINSASLHTALCAELIFIIESECPNLKVDLRTHTSFEELFRGKEKIRTDGVIDPSKFSVSSSGSNQIMILSVYYPWPLLTGFLHLHVPGIQNGKIIHFTQTVWKNEPF